MIEPFAPRQVNPNSYNYRLGPELLELTDTVMDPKLPLASRHIPLGPRGHVLRPGKLYLAHTLELIGSRYYVTSLIGRSTMGRLGLWLQVTADLGHLGAQHKWTLELKVVQPLRIYPGMLVGQVTFWHHLGNSDHQYQGKYAHDISSEPSRIRVELA